MEKLKVHAIFGYQYYGTYAAETTRRINDGYGHLEPVTLDLVYGGNYAWGREVRSYTNSSCQSVTLGPTLDTPALCWWLVLQLAITLDMYYQQLQRMMAKLAIKQ